MRLPGTATNRNLQPVTLRDTPAKRVLHPPNGHHVLNLDAFCVPISAIASPHIPLNEPNIRGRGYDLRRDLLLLENVLL